MAPLPVLVAAPRVRAWEAFTLAAWAWLLGSLNLWEEARTIGSIPGLLVLLIFPSIAFGCCSLLFRAWILRGGVWQAALAVPVAWVAAEFLCAQLGARNVRQPRLYPIRLSANHPGGLARRALGDQFLPALGPGDGRCPLELSRPTRKRKVLFSVVLLLFAAVFMYGHRRLEGARAGRGGP